MRKFEYLMKAQSNFGSDLANVQWRLDQLGNDGWELCAIDWGHMIFKREIPNEAAE